MINLIPENNEYLDVVSDFDMVIESRSRYDIHRLGLLHREVHVWLFDKDRNVYFQKSAAHKSSAGLMDASIGGHVDKGEDYLTAAVRETKEESGLIVSPLELVLLTKIKGVSEHKKKGIKNNFIRAMYVYKSPVSDNEIKADFKETDGFHKFSFDFLSNLTKEQELLFHKFVPTHELPFLLDYLKKK